MPGIIRGIKLLTIAQIALSGPAVDGINAGCDFKRCITYVEDYFDLLFKH